jgi:sterol desaturase/sphingolipid hydroxylase (fatty acid hydroxylase superfamily)
MSNVPPTEKDIRWFMQEKEAREKAVDDRERQEELRKRQRNIDRQKEVQLCERWILWFVGVLVVCFLLAAIEGSEWIKGVVGAVFLVALLALLQRVADLASLALERR